jgi:hypothetical protein
MVNLLTQPVLPETISVLSTEEKVRLHQLELEIERNLTGFIKCGRCLLEIRESRLWRGRYNSFSDYCRERFALARSTCDQICRSTQVYETLNTTLAGSDTPVAETTPEIVLRPLTQLADPALQTQTWRLAASMSPNGQPTRTVSARVTRMVREAIKPERKERKTEDRDPMFVRPVQRLAKTTFNPELAILHVSNAVQATNIIKACETVQDRCRQIVDHLNRRFA